MMPKLMARSQGKGRDIGDLIQELHWVVYFSKTLIPRCLFAHDPRKLVLVLDACLEAEQNFAGTDALMLGEVGRPCRYISQRIPAHIFRKLQVKSRHVIASLEVLPVLISICVWQHSLLHRNVFFCIVNEAAKSSLINMASNVPSIQMVLR